MTKLLIALLICAGTLGGLYLLFVFWWANDDYLEERFSEFTEQLAERMKIRKG